MKMGLNVKWPVHLPAGAQTTPLHAHVLLLFKIAGEARHIRGVLWRNHRATSAASTCHASLRRLVPYHRPLGIESIAQNYAYLDIEHILYKASRQRRTAGNAADKGGIARQQMSLDQPAPQKQAHRRGEYFLARVKRLSGFNHRQ